MKRTTTQSHRQRNPLYAASFIAGAIMVLVLMGVGLLGACGGIGAQEGGLQKAGGVPMLPPPPMASPAPPPATSVPALPALPSLPSSPSLPGGASLPLLDVPMPVKNDAAAPGLPGPPAEAIPVGPPPISPAFPLLPPPPPVKVQLPDPLPKRDSKIGHGGLANPEIVVPPRVEKAQVPAAAAPGIVGPAEKPADQVKTFVRISGAAASPLPKADLSQAGLPPPPAPLPPAPRPIQALGKIALPAPVTLAAALVQLQTPALVVEKRGATVLQPGEAQVYQIVVRNQSSVPAQQVRLEDQLPPDARLIAADPAPQMQGNRAVWVLPVLAARGEQTLQLTLQGGAAAEFLTQTSVHVSAGSSGPPAPAAVVTPVEAREIVRPAPAQKDALAVFLFGPARIYVGKPAVFEVRVTNQSNHTVKTMKMFGSLPEGLSHPAGPEIEGSIENSLKPGETKLLKMPTRAVKMGRYSVCVKVTTHAGSEASALTTIEIEADTLTVRQANPGRLFVGREAVCRIEVTNPTRQLIRNVTIVNPLAEGLDFVTASDHGMYQGNSRQVYWLLDLAPGETRALLCRVHPAKAGQYPNQVTAGADGVPPTSSSDVLRVDSVSDLSLNVKDRDNPLEVGRETVYEIRVVNSGSSPATNVRLQVQIPPGMTPRKAEGKTGHMLDHQTFVFEPLALLGPQGEAVYRVSAAAQATGDQHVRFSVASEQTAAPITREISTLVYRD